VFLVAAPILAVSVGHRAYRGSISELQNQRSWREVTAVVVHKAPVEPGSYDATDSWTLGRIRRAIRPAAGAAAAAAVTGDTLVFAGHRCRSTLSQFAKRYGAEHGPVTTVTCRRGSRTTCPPSTRRCSHSPRTSVVIGGTPPSRACHGTQMGAPARRW
jgi:hypothetical protein